MKFELKGNETLVDLIKSGKIPLSKVTEAVDFLIDEFGSNEDERTLSQQIGISMEDLGRIMLGSVDLPSYFKKYI